MNLYSFFKKKHSKPFLGAIFAAVFLSAFFALKAPAQASGYLNFVNLFTTDKTDPKPARADLSPASSFSVLEKVNTSAVGVPVPKFKFQFVGSFPYQGDSNPHKKEWYWDHIRGFTNSDYVFVVRVCDTSVSDESACYYTKIDSLPNMSQDQALFKNSDGSCTIPADKTNPSLPTSKIYHYGAENVAVDPASHCLLNSTNEAFTRFNVTFSRSRTELGIIKDDGSDIVTADLGNRFQIGDPASYKASIWYCGGNPALSDDVLPTGEFTPDIRKFKGLCGSSSGHDHYYFKIAESDPFAMPKDAAAALNEIQNPGQTQQVDASVVDENTGRVLPVCHILNGAGPGEGTFMACIAQIGYYAIYMPSAWIAGILGRIMDFFLGYSISDESYRSTVIITGWKLVRDISNIFFIIILIWTGFATVFDFEGVSMKKVVPALIINALFINFSLFGTQVIIDISNVTARLFYNTMSVCKGPCEYKNTPTGREISNLSTDNISGYKPLSTKIVDSFDPQKIFTPQTLNPNNATPTDTEGTDATVANGGFNASGVSGNLEASKKLGIYDSDYASYFLIVSLLAAFIMLAMAKMFFGVMFMFVGRVVGLYMSMIFSPFAVLTRGNMPLVSKIKELSWSSWLEDLTNYALLAPIFIFFLYIIYAFINSDLMKVLNLKASAGFMDTVITVCIPMIIVYMLVASGVKIAKKYAGAAGEMIQKYATQATGMVAGAAVGVASGGLAFAGRNVVGRGMALYGNGGKKTELDKDGKEIVTTRATRWAANANNGWFSRKRNNIYSAAQTSSWDIRNAGVKIAGKDQNLNSALGSGLGFLGVKVKDQVSGAIGIGQDKALGKGDKPGGNIMIDKKRADAAQKDLENRVLMSHLSEDESKAAWEKYKSDRIKKFGDTNWENNVDVEDIAKNSKSYKDLKKNEEDLRQSISTATSATAKATYEQALAQNKTAQEATLKQQQDIATGLKESNKEDFQKLRLQTIEGLKKNDEYKKSSAFELASDEEAKRLNKYGKIKDNKSFVAAMRAEYVEGISKSSFGKLEALKSGIFAGLITGMVPGLTVLSGIFGGALIGGLADNMTGARTAAIKAIIDKANKTSGKGSALAALEAKVSKHEEEVLKAVNEALGLKDGKEYKKFSDLDDEQDKLEEGLARKEAALDAEIEEFKESAKNLTGDAKRDALYQKQRRVNELAKLKNSMKNMDQARKDLSAFKDKQKEKEDNAKKAEDNKK